MERDPERMAQGEDENGPPRATPAVGSAFRCACSSPGLHTISAASCGKGLLDGFAAWCWIELSLNLGAANEPAAAPVTRWKIQRER